MIFIGTAGWSIPARYAAHFPPKGSHLERYSQVLNAAEINTSFYKPHQRKTYERWAASVPKDFRFCVKLPRSISHNCRLQGYDSHLSRFLDEVSGLHKKLGTFLVQLPPSLAYDQELASASFHDLRRRSPTPIACEPRHASWLTPEADAFLKRLHVARVAADPPRASDGGKPGGWKGLRYWRMHGSPRMYYSDYDEIALKALAENLRRRNWCIFDNTAASAALGNALTLQSLTAARRETRPPESVDRSRGPGLPPGWSQD
ncbi:MAG TPA: DUF72 domain-containing protein, partial [Rhizomicrobium sp.]|nr:DUF72 domain-containing protein [Rhizomicrobium sp.]